METPVSKSVRVRVHACVHVCLCAKCPSITYVGPTGRSIRERANEHNTDIRIRRVGKPVAAHFCDAGHGLQDFRALSLIDRPVK